MLGGALLMATMFVAACSESDPPVTPTEKEELSVELTCGEVTSSTVNFTLESNEATEVRWLCIDDSRTTPNTATVLLTGRVAEANQTLQLKVEGLTAESNYTLVAAATDGTDSVSDKLSFTTLASEITYQEPVITIEPLTTEESSLQFRLATQNAEVVKWVCIEKGSRDITVDQVLKNGASAESNSEETITAEGLKDGTTYQIYVAAQNPQHKVMHEPVEMTTVKAAPPVENYIVEGSTAMVLMLTEGNPKGFYIAIYDTERNYTFKADLYTEQDALYPATGEYPLGEAQAGYTTAEYTTFFIEDHDTAARKFSSGSLSIEAEPNEESREVYFSIEGEFELLEGGIVTVIYEGPIQGIELPEKEPEEGEEEKDPSRFTFKVSPETSAPVRMHYASMTPGTYTLKFFNRNWSELIIEIVLDPSSCNEGNDPLPEGTYTMAEGSISDYSQVKLYSPDPYFSCSFSSATATVSRQEEIYTISFEGKGNDPYATGSIKERTIVMEFTGEIKEMTLE